MKGRRRQLFLVTAVIAVVGAFRAEGGQERLIAKLSPQDLTPSLTKAIAAVGVLTKVTVRAHDTLREIVRLHCQRDDPNFLELLIERSVAIGIPGKISADYQFPAEATLELPYCLRLPTGTPPGVGWLGLPVTAGLDLDDRFGAIRATAATNSWNADASWSHAGEPGSSEATAESISYVEVPLRNDVSAEQAITTVNSGIPEEKKARPAQKGIKHITVLSPNQDNCASPSSVPEKYPVDTYSILRVLGLNRAVKPELASDQQPLIVGDSGLYYDSRAGIFTEANVEPRPFDKTAPAADYARSQHGTYVATAALGGPYFMRFGSLLNPHFRIRARNIISKVQGCEQVAGEVPSEVTQDYCEIDDQLLSNLMSSSTTGAIVNLSVAHAGEIQGLEKELLLANGRSLIVAAAGNTGVEIMNDSYPAKLAQHGRLKESILVVSALESDGKALSKTSSYHPAWVELATYGCKIPVYEFVKVDPPHFKVVQKSGTSMAAPLVAFAASLVKMQMDMTPALIKRRLIVSADYEPGLKKKVKNNARLNIPRALALFHDVVTLKGGDTIFGRLKNGDFVIGLCGGRQSKRRSELRSIAIYNEGLSQRVFFYYGGPDEQQKETAALEFGDCLLSEPNPDNEGFDLSAHTLRIEDAEAGGETEFALKDVTSITFAYAPYWEH